MTGGLRVAVVGALLVACIPGGAEGEVRMYMRNLPGTDLAYRIEFPGGSGGGGLSPQVSAGCTAVGFPWTLRVGPANRGEPSGDMQTVLTSEELDNPASVEMWIDLQPDGHVTVGQGRPDWYDHEVLHCGPFTDPGDLPGPGA